MVGTAEELTIQQVAEGTGLTVHTIRYYERAGLLPPVARNGGGHRRYLPHDVDSLLFLTRLRTTGMPIHGVRRYAELVREGDQTMAARQRMLEAHREAVRAHMDELALNLRVLDFKIGLYESGRDRPEPGDPAVEELKRLVAACGTREENE